MQMAQFAAGSRDSGSSRGADTGEDPTRALGRAHEEITAAAAREEELLRELYACLATGGNLRADALRTERRELHAEALRLREQISVLERAVRRAEQAEHVPIAESLTARAREADRRRTEALWELDATLLRAFAKLVAFERAQQEVLRARERAEGAWLQAGCDLHEARERVGVAAEAPFERLGHSASLWMRSVLRYLRAARADFKAWWKP